jgi:sugar lactone lactonase YvrE
MFHFVENSRHSGFQFTALVMLAGILLTLATPAAQGAKKKKEAEQPAAKPQVPLLERLDYSKIVWPNPPAITRVKYLNYFANEKYVPEVQQSKKSSWMDRLAGGQTQAEKRAAKPLYALWNPYGLAVDSKNRVYVADGRVGAIFIFNAETKDVEMIKHGQQARFGFIVGLAMDDNDRLFVSDSHMHRVLVFNAQHQLEGSFAEGMVDPGGMAIDTENRFIYVADATLDQVLVYDADNFRLLRKIGTCCKKSTLTTQGDFSKPTNLAVDQEGNLYVADTWNNRVEIFDADGQFIRAWGKHGDGPGHFARPKGIAIDADGHVWVADAVQDRLQCFTPEGKLLMWMGGHGGLPGQFSDLAGLAIDKNNRIFTSEQYPGRVQMFRYFTNTEALAEYDRRQAEEKKKSSGAKPQQAGESAPAKPATSPVPVQKSTAPEKTPG